MAADFAPRPRLEGKAQFITGALLPIDGGAPVRMG